VPIGEGDEDFDKDVEATVKLPGYSVFTEGNAPSTAQAAYPFFDDGTFKKNTPSEPIFEGVRVETNSYQFGSMRAKHTIGENDVCPESGNVPRQVLKPNSSALKAYNDHYIGQMSDIIQGMFAGEIDAKGRNPAADPENWNFTQTVVWGGIDHQHQHCDQGQAGSFHYEQIFPFVVLAYTSLICGFCQRKKREYGFPYRFPAKSILFMRGDFVHAGGCSQPTRAHLEFFPKPAAGWTKTQYPYWANAKQFEEWLKKKNTFLVPDLRSFPFSFPEISEDPANGSLIITYPNRPDDEELFPQLQKPKLARKYQDEASTNGPQQMAKPIPNKSKTNRN
jgi:hypothetical protein